VSTGPSGGPASKGPAGSRASVQSPAVVTGDVENVHTGNIEQGIGPGTPTRARTARTVIHVGAFSRSVGLVATDLEGPDTDLGAPPRSAIQQPTQAPIRRATIPSRTGTSVRSAHASRHHDQIVTATPGLMGPLDRVTDYRRSATGLTNPRFPR
jgi:hypothetical protein